MAYNVAMVLLSTYLFVKFGLLGWFSRYDYKCQPVDYSNSDSALEVNPFRTAITSITKQMTHIVTLKDGSHLVVVLHV